MVVHSVISGPDNAVWWTEYVIRNGGARHLRSPAVGVTFIEYYMLDLLSYLIAAVLFLLFLTYYILRSIVRRLMVRFFSNQEVGVSGKFKEL